MGRGYSDDYDGDETWPVALWRSAVNRSFRGKRGQAFLREMQDAMHSLGQRKLIARELEQDGAVCALGTVAKARGIDMSKLDPDDNEQVAHKLGIAHAMAAEIAYVNDEWGHRHETPEERFERMRQWIEEQIIPAKSEA